MGKIQRKRAQKSKKKINKSTLKKDRPFEVLQEANYWMLLEILSWLPVKSLLRFMSVCKYWRILISSHPFRKLHREKHSSSPPFVIAFYNTYHMKRPYYNDLKDHMKSYLVTSDLEGKSVETITLPLPSIDFTMINPPYQSKLLFFANTESKKFNLYNPSTRQLFRLPNPFCFSSPKFSKFHRHYSTVYGYIKSKDEYIVVHLVESYGKLGCEVLNISISNDNFKLHYNQWRFVIDKANNTIHDVSEDSYFAGGAFYWQVSTFEYPGEPFFLSFDVENESFSTFGYPEDLLVFSAELFVLEDDLYLVDFPETPEYVLKDDVYMLAESPVVLAMWKLSSDKKKAWTNYWEFDFERLFGFKCIASLDERYFRWKIFLYHLKYLKGFDQQPEDDQVSVEMGELRLVDGSKGMPIWDGIAVHTNLFTL